MEAQKNWTNNTPRLSFERFQRGMHIDRVRNINGQVSDFHLNVLYKAF